MAASFIALQGAYNTVTGQPNSGLQQTPPSLALGRRS
jgi:hypothetical protein